MLPQVARGETKKLLLLPALARADVGLIVHSPKPAATANPGSRRLGVRLVSGNSAFPKNEAASPEKDMGDRTSEVVAAGFDIRHAEEEQNISPYSI